VAARGWIQGADPHGKPPQAFRLAFEVINSGETFRLCLPADIVNFEALPVGTLLAEDGERRWVLDREHARVLFPLPDVAVGERAALIVEP
jgi:succinylglutamate desuccinylase